MRRLGALLEEEMETDFYRRTNTRKGSKLQSRERKRQQAVWWWPEPLDYPVHAQDISTLGMGICMCVHSYASMGDPSPQGSAVFH